MNCAECKELLVAGLEGLLDDTQKQAVKEHLKTCEACRAELKGLQTLRERLVGNGKALAQSSVEDDVMNRIIREQSARLKSAAQAGMGLRIRRLIMRNPMAKIAAAAIVIVACAIGMMFWTGTESIALAQVLARVEQIQAYVYKTKMTTEDSMTGTTKIESTVFVSNDYGMRIDQIGTHSQDGRETPIQLRTYVLPQKKIVVTINLADKQYGRMTFDDATLENAQTKNRDPREIVKMMLGHQYRELGPSVIDGRKVQGFETTDPGFMSGAFKSIRGTLWVDVETWLPVRSETEMEVGEGIRASAVDYDYQWDAPIDASTFEPEIPAGFTADRMDGMQMSFSERGFIEALRVVVEFTGHYPKAVDSDGLRQLSMEIAEAMTTSDRPAAQQWREEIKQLKDAGGSKEAAIQAGQERMMKLMALNMFTMILSQQQKAPVYRGDVVTPNDIELPLMRWKLSDNQYRVIFGDLHAETVDADALAKLEAALPK
jgi:outer membrane lipoprotein-sorting protein